MEINDIFAVVGWGGLVLIRFLMCNFRVVFASLIIALIGVVASSAEQKSYGSWKDFMPSRLESLPEYDLMDLVTYADTVSQALNEECPVSITPVTNLSAINIYPDEVEIFVDFFGPLDYFFFDYDEKKDVFLPDTVSNEESCRRIINTLVIDVPRLNIASHASVFVESGKAVTINIIENNDEDDDSSEFSKGARAVFYPDGSLGDIEIMDYPRMTRIIIVDPDEDNDTILAIDDLRESDYELDDDDYLNDNSDYEISLFVDEPAEFPGGMDALMEWLSENIIYPQEAADNDIQGKVIVRFIVEKDGSIGKAVIVKGVHKDLDRESLRVVKAMPRWEPGKIDGRSVRSYYNLPITFQLASDPYDDDDDYYDEEDEEDDE